MNGLDQAISAGAPSRSHKLHIEIALRSNYVGSLLSVQIQWAQYLESAPRLELATDHLHVNLDSIPSDLAESVSTVKILREDDKMLTHIIDTTVFQCDLHVFSLSEEDFAVEEIDGGGDGEWTAGCDSISLPHKSMDGLWETIILEPQLKQRLLDYAQSALLFSDKHVSSNLVHWNRILLLHGVPGTGKTSLCRALAQKLAIRMKGRFANTILLDVRAHSLFSKWFSTSGKLVSSLFQMVRDMVQDDPDTLVCVLVDEVESLASSRNGSHGGDPSDAMRAVNSLLTSLDKLRYFSNVLVLATTNLTSSIDAAFLDRIDLKLHIGLPILKARYEILRSCVVELQRVGIVNDKSCNGNGSITLDNFEEQNKLNKASNSQARALLECAKESEGLSGRSLRRLPLQAHAQFVGGRDIISMDEFLSALRKAVAVEQSSRNDISMAYQGW